ncbi:glycosyltransferase family 4 protein [Flavobacteriaceae bacterium D16]|nr:glycosyltransferase family 4 protein [Flavobacteriaceae bacterium D16]
MRILLLGLVIGDMNVALNLYSELVVEIHNNGHHIDVVAPALDHNKTGIQKEAGINVLRVPTLRLFNVGFLVKGLANLLLPYQYKKALKKSGLDLNYDLIITPTPPITLGVLSKWFKKKYNSKVYVILRDIFPQNAIDLGIMSKSNPIYHYFRRQEKALYKTADYLGCMSQGNIDYVLKHNRSIEPRKLHLLPNWKTPKSLSKESEIKQIRKKYGLDEKFVAFFGGNIGKPQKVENIAALMEACLDIKDLKFLIVGNGNEKARLEELIQKKGLTNVVQLGRVSESEYHKLVQASDVGLISLSEDFTIPNIPSKTISYFLAKKPVLAATDVNTDYYKILEKSGAGLWSEASKIADWKSNLLYLMENRNKCREMGLNGYSYMKEHLVTSKAYERLIAAVESEQ